MCPAHAHFISRGELLESERVNKSDRENYGAAAERFAHQCICVCVLQVSFGCQLCLRCYTSCCWSLASVWCAWSFFTPVMWSMDSNWTPSPQSSPCCQVGLHPCPYLTLRESNCALLHYFYHSYRNTQPRSYVWSYYGFRIDSIFSSENWKS